MYDIQTMDITHTIWVFPNIFQKLENHFVNNRLFFWNVLVIDPMKDVQVQTTLIALNHARVSNLDIRLVLTEGCTFNNILSCIVSELRQYGQVGHVCTQ